MIDNRVLDGDEMRTFASHNLARRSRADLPPFFGGPISPKPIPEFKSNRIWAQMSFEIFGIEVFNMYVGDSAEQTVELLSLLKKNSYSGLCRDWYCQHRDRIQISRGESIWLFVVGSDQFEVRASVWLLWVVVRLDKLDSFVFRYRPYRIQYGLLHFVPSLYAVDEEFCLKKLRARDRHHYPRGTPASQIVSARFPTSTISPSKGK
ncbi:hypothetical protein SAMN04489751_3442 [Brevibacterium sandarakinum]|uniref:Uncharacterized protein n=1 Tax=Brevibacterium sandarakinum TaxID=629680 RepID=A0A1H1WRW7_BRESA|nr:hypothetical protein SAMN04489751_3442 [Brevibacterium sandarakinum]